MSSLQRILIVGAGWEQLPIIERARARGFEVVAVDGNAAAPGLAYAHHARVVSTRDQQAVLAVARTMNVSAVTFMITETPLRTIRFVTSRLGLPGPSEASVVISTDKAAMRERFAAAGIPNPPFARCEEPRSAREAAQQVGYPLIVKPVDSGGQRGVTLCRDAAALPIAVAAARAASPEGTIVLEGFVSGQEVNVVAMVQAGRVVAMTVSDRITADAPAFGVVRRHAYPAAEVGHHGPALHALVQASVDAMDLADGVVFPQIMLGSDGPVLLETGARVPGGAMRELFEAATGYDLVDFQLDVSLGRVAPLEAYRRSAGASAVVVRFLTADPGELRPGTVTGIHGEAAARDVAGISHVGVFAGTAVRDRIRPLRTGADRYYFVLAIGKDREAAHRATDCAISHLDFHDPDGRSLWRHRSLDT